jgi:predicted nucleic acid-binding protein
MKKVFLDTNIIIDLLAKRKPFFNDAAKLFSIADKQHITLYCSALSIANIYYIVFRNKNNADTNKVIKNLLSLLKPLPLNNDIILSSLNNTSFLDFEDAIQYHTAIAFETDIIITRNIIDFKTAKIPVLSSKEIIEYFEK